MSRRVFLCFLSVCLAYLRPAMMLSAPFVMSRCFPSGVRTMTDMRLRVLLKARVVSTLYVCGFPFTSIVTSPGPRPVGRDV